MREYERRYKLKQMPSEEKINGMCEIEQAYTNKEENSKPVNRIRREVHRDYVFYSHCTKYFFDKGIREEFSLELTEIQYQRLLEKTGKKPIRKKRFYVSIGEPNKWQVAEIDVFENGDMLVEVEFYDEESMRDFQPPSWFGQEIIDKKSYSANLFYQKNSSEYVWG